jgi:hypothetical protein
MTGSPLKTVNMAPHGGLCGLQQGSDNNSESPDSSSRRAMRKDSHVGKYTNSYYPPYGNSYFPLQWLFPSALQLYHLSASNMSQSSQPTSSTRKGFLSYGPPCPGYIPAPWWLWWVSNVPPSAVLRTRAVTSRCTVSPTRNARTSSR